MCNIAGYAGNRQAAPILLEMLRAQQPYDGDMSTGVATIHQGKLYYKKVAGDVDTFLKTFDLNELPGTLGIAHTRPGGASPSGVPMHPNLNMEETLALVTNGTTPDTQYCPLWDEAVDLLDQNGYKFIHDYPNPENKSPKLSRNGHHIGVAEARAMLVDYYLKQGKSAPEALALTCKAFYSDNATVFIHEQFPDRIFALRTTRPLQVIMEKGETYLATSLYGMPEDLKNQPFMLPLHHACSLTREGVTVYPEKIELEPVAEMTPYTYKEAYTRFEKLLTSEKAPLYFDQLEFAADEMRDLWEGDHTCVQHARLVYDMLYQFDREGRLKREMRLQERSNGTRHRWYFSLEK